MKKYAIIAGILVTAAAFTILFLRPFGHVEPPRTSLTADGGVYYTCPMHPSVISDRPGHCPVCGMTLVKKTRSEPAASGQAPSDVGDVAVSGDRQVQSAITTVGVRRVAFADTVSAPGVVTFAEPGRSVVAARARGRVERLFVDRTGMVVRKGEPLLSLYSPDLLGAEEEYIISLAGNGDSSGLQLGAASRRRLVEKFGLTDAQISRLERTRAGEAGALYVSPLSGTVIRKEVVEGQYVEEGTMLFELADLSRVWVIASVPEQEVGAVRPGQPVEVTLGAPGDRAFRGRVAFIEPVLDAPTRTVRVRTEIANREGTLRPNMYARVSFTAAPREALVVPTSAVLFTGRRPVVWVESAPGRFSPRTVRVGATSGSDTEILAGVAEGDRVASTGGFLIDSESRLRAPGDGSLESPSQAR